MSYKLIGIRAAVAAGVASLVPAPAKKSVRLCSWCATKRKATAEIGNLAHVPAHRLVANNYISARSLREAYRDELRAVYRQTLRRLENDDQGLFET